MAEELVGFIGLGNMGRPMAANVARKGIRMIVHDIAGTADRAPKGALVAQSNGEVARRAGVVFLSLPSLKANEAVIAEIAEAGHTGSTVIDTSTIGVDAAKANAARLAAAGIHYLDSPVSGLAFRAQEGTLATMCSGSAEALERARDAIMGYSRVIYHVGTEPGQGQRMKLVNNALCITAYVLTSEALLYGENGGLDMDTMLEVINASSGMNFSTSVIFPKYVATKKYDESGCEAHVPSKDVSLFMQGAKAEGTPHDAIASAYEIFKAFAESDPKADQMRIYPYVKSLK
jgi:3-hydroxyisobutyrate dehydrogenase-like beta-hydroxyacid dehydrogenase